MREAERDELVLDAALDERVFELERREFLVAAPFGERLRAGRIPRGHVTEADVADFARAHEVVKGAHDLFGGREPVPRVEQVEIGITHELAKPALAVAVRVKISRIEEIAAGGEIAVEENARGRLIGAPAPVGAEGHGAEREAGDAKAGVAESVVGGFHGGVTQRRRLLWLVDRPVEDHSRGS